MATAFQSDGGTVFAAANNNNAIAVPLPATRPNGSVLLFVGFSRLITDTVATAPAGYTLLGTYTSGTAAGGRIWVYGRIVDGTESTPNFATASAATGTSGDLWGACIYCYSGIDTAGGLAGIIDGTPTISDASGTTTCTFAALTTAVANSLVIRLLARWRDAADTFTPTATWNEREDASSTNRTGVQHFLQDKPAVGSGAQASVTVAPSNTTAARYLAVTLALKERVVATVTGGVNFTGAGGSSIEGVNVLLTGQVLTGEALCGVKPMAVGPPVVSGAIAFSGTGALVAGSGIRTKVGALALTGVGALSATGRRTKLGALVLAGVGSMSATGKRTTFQSLVFSGVGSLAAVGVRKKLGAILFSGLGSLAGTARLGRKGQAVFSGQGALYANPGTGSFVVGRVAFSGTGSLSAAATTSRNVHIPEPLVELLCGPSVITGSHLVGHIFSGDRWNSYQIDLLTDTLTIRVDQSLLSETGTLELPEETTSLTYQLRIQIDETGVLELVADSADIALNQLLLKSVCRDIELLTALEEQYALPSAPGPSVSLVTTGASAVTLTAAPKSTISLDTAACEED